MLKEINNTANWLKSKLQNTPSIGIVLGTGLGNFANEIDVEISIPYRDIPNFPVSTVVGHHGNLIFGKLQGKNIVAMQGRFHYYEGYSMNEVVFPIRVMKQLGVRNLFISNAAGGVNPQQEIGDLMLIEDHISLFPDNPLIGNNIDELGPRFPNMNEPYNKKLIQSAVEIAQNNNIKLTKGVYVGLTGPVLETLAEYKYIRIIGGDAVGMSTIPEVIAAIHMKMKCFAISIITDLGVEGKIHPITIEEIQQVANEQEPKMTLIIKELIKTL